jgi:pSer/pThr/pTyr-binding forkhead associated (FHA) protein
LSILNPYQASFMKSPPVILVQLIHIEGPMKGEIQEFSDAEITIGRHPECHVQFPKDMTTISRRHARIIREGNRFKMVNQGPNGTLVNGKRVEEAYLKDGDVLTITENGPKVSFLTEVKEGSYVPPQAPSAQPEPQVPLKHSETPRPSSQPESAAPRVQRKPAATPIQPETPAPLIQPKPVAKQPQPEIPSPQVQPKPPEYTPQQRPVAAQAIRIERVQVPLMIQLGPTLRSFKEVPVTLGKSPGCDFVLNYPAIIDQHAQIFFSQDQYWVKDLTGRQSVSINNQPIDLQAPLHPDDRLSLSASGPRFRFLGGGRLAEIEEPVQEMEPQLQQEKPSDISHEGAADKVIKGAKSVFDKFLKR